MLIKYVIGSWDISEHKQLVAARKLLDAHIEVAQYKQFDYNHNCTNKATYSITATQQSPSPSPKTDHRPHIHARDTQPHGQTRTL